jgi:predicted ATPase
LLSTGSRFAPINVPPILIRSLEPQNFLSFGPETKAIELKALNLLVGPNGSGKSNLIEVISLLRAAPKDWQEATRKGGGVGEWIWKGNLEQPASLKATFPSGGPCSSPLIHEVAFQEQAQRFDLVEEKIHANTKSGGMGPGFYWTDFKDYGPRVARLTTDGEQDWLEAPYKPGQSVLSLLRDPVHYPEITWLADAYDEIRIYREWSFGRNSLFRNPQPADMRSTPLAEDFSNLGLYLNRIKSRFPAAKRAILSGLQELYDGITDFEISASGGSVQIFLHEGDFVIPASRLSDGTLRYLCLLAILCDPEPPPLICLEEPELGLHPDILPGLADLLREASGRTQLIVTTHSDILVDEMTETPECVLVCEKLEGKTEMKHLSSEELESWLKEYRLGELWIKGQLGGKRW